jgi:hypothetical protein
MKTPLTQASGIRRARTYAKVERSQGDSDDYPVGCSAFLNSIHDARYYQGILSNARNFTNETNCDVFHVQDGQASWRHDANEDAIQQYIEVSLAWSPPSDQVLILGTGV